MLANDFFYALFAIFGLAAPACADVLKIIVNDTIQPITDEFIGRALAQAKATGAQALLIEITRRAAWSIPPATSSRRLSSRRSGHRLCRADRRKRGSGWILHSGIRGHRCYGAGNQYRRGASRDAGRRKMDEVMKHEGGERFRRLHALVRRPRGRNVD